jgi:hypothetical protein
LNHYPVNIGRKVDTEAVGVIAATSQLPRYVSLHQLALRTGINRNALTMTIARGQLMPTAMQDLGDGRETFLFPVGAIGRLKSHGNQQL